MRNRLPVLVPAATLSLWSLFGCVPLAEKTLSFEGAPRFNERIRLDRAGLADAQIGLDPEVGAFRDGFDDDGKETEIVSELLPMFEGCPSDDPSACPTEKLLQSDCWWVAANSVTQGLDVVTMNWEVVLDFARGTFTNDPTGAKEFGACRAGEPVTGERAKILLEKSDTGPSTVRLPGFDFSSFSAPNDEELMLDLGFDLPFTAVELEVVEPASSDGVCPQRTSLAQPWRPFPGPGSHLVATYDTSPQRTSRETRASCRPVESVDEDGASWRVYPACAYRCGILPTLDGSVRAAITMVEDGQTTQVEHFLQPNLLVVPKSRTIERPMTEENGRLVWHTPVLGNAEQGLRWHENWSPNVLVNRVRVFERRGEDEIPPILKDEGSGPELTLGRHKCRGEVTTKGVVFHLFDPDGQGAKSGCGAEGGALLATPGYLRETLSTASAPIVQPLRWETILAERPRGDVFLELTLRVEDAGSTSIVGPPLVAFGKQEMGLRRSEMAVLRNNGSTVVEIDSVWIGGPQRAEFTARPLGPPVMLPLPIGLGRSDGGVTVALIPGHENDLDPLYESALGFGTPHLRLRASDHGGGLAMAYGATLDFTDGYPLLVGPAPRPAVVPASGMHLFAGRAIQLEQRLPFQLAPGESFEVAVTAEPQGWGDRVGELHVEGYPIAQPGHRFDVVSALTVEGAAAEAYGLPETIVFPGRGNYVRAALLENPGSLPLVRQTISIVGAHAQLFRVESSHALTQDLDPGESEVFTVRYAPAGQTIPAGLSYHEARLEIATTQGTVVYELLGRDPLDVSPSRLSFTNGVRTLQVQLYNSSLHPIERQSLHVDGPDLRLFTWADPRPWVVLQPGESDFFEIEYTPSCTPPPASQGNLRLAELLIVTDWGTERVSLEGEFSLFHCSP